MLNPFPDLLTYILLSPLLLRVAVGIFLIRTQHNALRFPKNPQERVIAVVSTLAGIMLVVGFYTQIAALVTIFLTAYMFWKKMRTGELFPASEKWVSVFVIVIALSLLFSGAGGFAIDIPL